MICTFCQETILESRSERNWGFHHCNPVDLEISAVEGCVFCSRLARRLRGATRSLVQSWYERVEPGKAAYRWSIKKAASISELGERIILTFRSLPSMPKDSEGDAKSDTKLYTDDEIFYLFPEADLSFPPLPHELGFSTACTQSWNRVNKWFEDCKSYHPECQRHTSLQSFRPTRLLDIESSDSAWPPKAIQMNCVTDLVETYVTLSHSWGLKPEFSRLLKENFEQWTTTGIPWSDICSNTNFVHAVEVARRIKARYLWIDSLCIIQNSDDDSDWLAEAPKMQDVYLHSSCNIAASDSSDAYGGIFRSRDGHRLAAAQYTGVLGKSCVLLGTTTWRVVTASLWQNGLLEGPLYARGWVFQERMLAPRILHYSREQIYWDCATVSACETLPGGMPLELDTKARVDRQWRGWLRAPPREDETMSVDSFWASVVSTYSSSNLTKQRDKLLAIWGIAAPVAEKQKREWGAWGAGLWAANLEQQLAWTVVAPGDKTRPIDPDLEKFPTWSWASVVGTVALAQLWAPEAQEAQEAHKAFYTVSSHGGSQTPIFFESVSGNSSGEEKSIGVKCKSIRMQCHVGVGEVRYDTGRSRIWLQIEGKSGDTRDIEVFPDTNLPDRTPVEFLILLASRGPKREWTKDGYSVIPGDMGDDTDIEYYYSGAGLLVQRDEKTGFYNRLGVFKFSELSQDQWDDIRRACGDEGNGNTSKFDPMSSSAKSIILE